MRRRRSTHSAQYRAHLASPQWQAIRRAALERAKHRCAFCATDRKLEVHHNSYARLGHEQPEDLTVLCDNCHKAADRQRRLAAGGRVRRKTGRRVWRKLPRAARFLITMFVLVCLAPYFLPLFGNGVLVGESKESCKRPERAVRVYLSKAKYPNIVAHIKESWRKGYPHVLKVHRRNVDERRERLLRRYPTREGYDRDEAPAAVLRASWRADVAYVPSGENRSAGAVLGNAIADMCSGTRVMYVFTR